MRSLLASASLLALVLAALPARAQTGDDLPRLRVTDPGRDLFKLALPRAGGDAALGATATEIESRDLSICGLFRLLDPVGFPGALHDEGLGFSSALWSQVGAQGVAKLEVRRDGAAVILEGRLYRLGRGETPVLAKSYRGADREGLRSLVHAWASDVVESFTGTPGPFGSRIVFALTGSGPHEIGAVDMDGARMAVLTRMGSDSVLPAVSPGGGEVAFTSFLRNNPDLWVVSASGGRARRLSQQAGLNTGATWAPGGATVALTLSFEGNADIYRIRASDGSVVEKLVTNPAIDSSPSFSPDGSQLAFVSNRGGTPQIWIAPVGGTPRRVTYQGRYNQTPRWCPRADRQALAFTGRDERGVFDVFVLDIKSGRVDRVTQDQGSNIDPAWSRDGRLLVYASNRGGLYIANPETRQETAIWKGGAASPSWGPAPARPAAR